MTTEQIARELWETVHAEYDKIDELYKVCCEKLITENLSNGDEAKLCLLERACCDCRNSERKAMSAAKFAIDDGCGASVSAGRVSAQLMEIKQIALELWKVALASYSKFDNLHGECLEKWMREHLSPSEAEKLDQLNHACCTCRKSMGEATYAAKYAIEGSYGDIGGDAKLVTAQGDWR